MATKELVLSIADAFKLRNKIKAKIAELSMVLQREALYKDPDLTTEESLRAFDGIAFDTVVCNAEALMDSLCALNTAIDTTNVRLRDTLNALETLKVKQSLNKNILDKIRGSAVFETKVNTVSGETIKTRLVPIFENKDVYVQKEKDFALQKQKLEDEIAAGNASLKFTYTIDEAVYELIYS